MAKNIEPKLKKIGDYLKLEEDTVFTIPEYQRAYSWGIDNCDKLWQDINDFVDSESKDRYFFGTIIINCQDEDTKYGLIDGQQRTTTFLLLLKALLVRINIAIERTTNDEDSASLCRGLQERRRRIMGILYKAETEDISDKPDRAKDAEICRRTLILENFSINEQYKTELKTILQSTDYDMAEANVIKIRYKQKDNRYTNFFRNFKFFYMKISELSDSQLNSIAKAITDNCEVIEIKSWQVEQAITMFNSLNSDGLPLYDSDIISAKLYAAAERDGKEKEFSALWKDLNDVINELESIHIADINSILMQYMYYVRTVNKETISETGAINVTTPGLRRYFTEINKAPIANPILVYLNEYLFAQENSMKFDLGTKYDIEHIMPYSGSNLQEIRRDAEIENEEEFAGIVNKLGNKILLEEKINRAIGNEWFRTKVSTKLENKTGYIDSEYPIARALVAQYQNATKPYWKKDDLASATEKASERILNFIFGL